MAVYRDDLLAQVKIHAIDSIWTLSGCYREVTCLYGGHYIQVPLHMWHSVQCWNMCMLATLGLEKMADMQK